MRKRIQHWIAALLFVTTIGGATFTVATPQTTFAACTDRLLTFPAWYRGITDGNCEIQNPGTFGLQKFIWTIVLNVVEVLLQVVGYVAVAFVITGGFKYMTSAGSPDGMVKAKNTILNALIGLGLSMASIAIVNLIAGAIR